MLSNSLLAQDWPQLSYYQEANKLLKTSEKPIEAVFFGDSKKDYEISLKSDLKFVFVSDYSSFKNFKDFFSNKENEVIKNFPKIKIVH